MDELDMITANLKEKLNRNTVDNVTVFGSEKGLPKGNIQVRSRKKIKDLDFLDTRYVQSEAIGESKNNLCPDQLMHNNLKESSSGNEDCLGSFDTLSFPTACDICQKANKVLKLPKPVIELMGAGKEIEGNALQEVQSMAVSPSIEYLQQQGQSNKHDFKELFSPELLHLLNTCLPELASKYPCISALHKARSFCMMSESSENCELLVRSLPSGVSTEEDVASTSQIKVACCKNLSKMSLQDDTNEGLMLGFDNLSNKHKNAREEDRSEVLKLDLSGLKHGSGESSGNTSSAAEFSATVRSYRSDKWIEDELSFSSSSSEMIESVVPRSAPEGGNPSEEGASGNFKKNTGHGSFELRKRLERQATFVIEKTAQSQVSFESEIEKCEQTVQRERPQLNITSDEIDRIMRVFQMTQEK